MNPQSHLSRLGLFDARVPRYTSYPTAPQFSTSVGPSQFRKWIAAIPEGSAISVYVHVPFCRRLCWFCACRTQGTSTDSPVRAYEQTLLAEIELLRRLLPAGVRLSRLHWGGGTPTILAPDSIRRLAAAIFAALPMTQDGEFSVEIDPNEIDGARLDALAGCGMNRASVGVQDFDPAIQQAIGREQSYEVTRDTVDALRARGVRSLNADILFGLPHQTRSRIAGSVEQLLSLKPDRVALYGYAHVPWMSRRQQLLPSDAMPTPQERLSLFEEARALFLRDHYDEIGIDHFARPEDGMARASAAGRLRRNFQGYTEDPSPVLIGLGASSISRFPQGYAQNAVGTSDHAQAVKGGAFSTCRGHEFAGDDVLRGRIIEALMCGFRVDRAELLDGLAAEPGQIDALFHRAVAQFDGLVVMDDAGLTIAPEARALTRMIARAFDAYDPAGKALHSAAI